MIKEQEAQQAQTIAEIKQNAEELANADHDVHTQHECRECFQDRAALLEIVDSQAQKIAEQTEIIAALRSIHIMKIGVEEMQKRIRETL